MTTLFQKPTNFVDPLAAYVPAKIHKVIGQRWHKVWHARVELYSNRAAPVASYQMLHLRIYIDLAQRLRLSHRCIATNDLDNPLLSIDERNELISAAITRRTRKREIHSKELSNACRP